MTQWLFFDLGNTLYDETLSDLERVTALLAKVAPHIPVPDFLEQMRAGAAAYAPSPFQYARKHFAIPHDEPYSTDKEVLFEGVPELLKALRERYSLAVLANQPSSTAERLKRDGIYGCFDICLLSETEGLSKPDPAFFEYGIKKAGCSPDRIAMIGDRLDNDIRPAKEAGMKTIRIRQGLSAVQEPISDEYRPDATVSSLNELGELLLGGI
ncbi:MAG: HAD family hydrolase [Oscillospiraceae bacterium]|nr:HAD family hydrolase [Oscillospiraceae bacterium]